MTPDDRVRALNELGFAPGQARFLAQVLVHSGYFVRRQHWEFLRIVKGARTAEFVQRLVEGQQATRTSCWRGAHALHVTSPLLYSTIGEPNSRLRRRSEPAAIVQRLMTLDVVIAHRDEAFLATEAEKVAFFTQECGVPPSDLPGKIYRDPQAETPPTTRYFVDRMPVQRAVGDHPVTFVYVPGWSQAGAFAAFLGDHQPLFRRLGRCRIRFCGGNEGLRREAQRLCRRLARGKDYRRPTEVRPVERRDALAHFRARQRFERQAFHTFTQQELDQLRADLARFAGPFWDDWYASWIVEGDQVPPPNSRAVGGLDLELVEEPLVHRYPLFGGLHGDW